MGQYLHWRIYQHYNAQHAEHWYEHHPEPVNEGNGATILWDFTIHTDRSVKTNWPDITVKNHKEKTCLWIVITLPSDRNVSFKEYEKVSKYKGLEIEIQKMWYLKATIIPVVIGALRMIKRKSEDHIKKKPGSPCLQELLKDSTEWNSSFTAVCTIHVIKILLFHNQTTNISEVLQL